MLTTYVQARAYRAPELLLIPDRLSYDTSIDIWAYGLIVLELFDSRTLFLCTDQLHHVKCLFQFLGACPYFEMDQSFENKLSYDDNVILMAKNGSRHADGYIQGILKRWEGTGADQEEEELLKTLPDFFANR